MGDQVPRCDDGFLRFLKPWLFLLGRTLRERPPSRKRCTEVISTSLFIRQPAASRVDSRVAGSEDAVHMRFGSSQGVGWFGSSLGLGRATVNVSGCPSNRKRP